MDVTAGNVDFVVCILRCLHRMQGAMPAPFHFCGSFGKKLLHTSGTCGRPIDVQFQVYVPVYVCVHTHTFNDVYTYAYTHIFTDASPHRAQLGDPREGGGLKALLLPSPQWFLHDCNLYEVFWAPSAIPKACYRNQPGAIHTTIIGSTCSTQEGQKQPNRFSKHSNLKREQKGEG